MYTERQSRKAAVPFCDDTVVEPTPSSATACDWPRYAKRPRSRKRKGASNDGRHWDGWSLVCQVVENI